MLNLGIHQGSFHSAVAIFATTFESIPQDSEIRLAVDGTASDFTDVIPQHLITMQMS